MSTYIADIRASRDKVEAQAKELKRLAEDLAVQKEIAVSGSRSKSEFLSTMSHEIRTPMTGVIGMANLMLETELDETQYYYATCIRDSGEALMTLLNDILDLAKIEAGKLDIEIIEFDPRAVTEDVARVLGSNLEAKGLSLEVDVENDVPRVLQGDPVRVRQILFNYLGNAIKFTERGGIKVHAEASENDAGQTVLRFSVTDSGIGIPENAQDRLFKQFVQADSSTTRNHGGTGLGLAICKNLSELMGGDVGFESEEGRGSTFWFTVTCDRPAKQVIELDRVGSELRYVAHRPLDILVVEDNRVNQALITAILDKLGHAVTIAENGAEGVERVHEGAYDLVLMDVRMPVMDGPTAAKTIRGMGGDKGSIPIIAVTADAMKERMPEYLKAGMDDCVTKPIDIGLLAETMDKVMGEQVHRVLEEERATETPPQEGDANKEPPEPESDPAENEEVQAFLKKLAAAGHK